MIAVSENTGKWLVLLWLVGFLIRSMYEMRESVIRRRFQSKGERFGVAGFRQGDITYATFRFRYRIGAVAAVGFALTGLVFLVLSLSS